MKIFKHRGDIYVSKSRYKSSREERILITLLILIVAVTIVFVTLLSSKYSSFSQFIAGDEVSVSTTVADENDDISLPSISGKGNFLIYETDDEQSVIHYAYILQIDADDMAYKTCAISPDTKIDGKSIYSIYSTGGGAALQNKLTSYLGIDIDYYVGFKKGDFVEYENKFGSFVYPSKESVNYDGGEKEDTYSVRIKEGEQKLQAIDVTNLLRYYIADKKNYTLANEIILYGYTSLFNSDNYENSETLFRHLMSSSNTNITVRDFENNKEVLFVFSKKNTDVTIYSCEVKYKNNTLTQESIKEMKGYFNK